jgi:hypothetical protein
MTDQPIPADPLDGAIADAMVDGLFKEIDRIYLDNPALAQRLEAAARERRFGVNARAVWRPTPSRMGRGSSGSRSSSISGRRGTTDGQLQHPKG